MEGYIVSEQWLRDNLKDPEAISFLEKNGDEALIVFTVADVRARVLTHLRNNEDKFTATKEAAEEFTKELLDDHGLWYNDESIFEDIDATISEFFERYE